MPTDTPKCDEFFKHVGISCTDKSKDVAEFARGLERHRNLLITENTNLAKQVQRLSVESMKLIK